MHGPLAGTKWWSLVEVRYTFHSHTDKRYKDSKLKKMLHRACALSSTPEAFNLECDKLRSIFSRLDYPRVSIDSIISSFLRNVSEQVVEEKTGKQL